MRRSFSPVLFTLLAAASSAALLVGCSNRRNQPPGDPPPHMVATAVVTDVSAPAPGYTGSDKALADALAGITAPASTDARSPGRPLNILAISGGGQYGAFIGGCLVGWSKHGDRPDFDIVTGISSGALLAAMAFGGPKYDQFMQDTLLTLKGSDMFKFRPVLYLIRYKALASTDPLKNLICRMTSGDYMNDLRASHAAGRRLFVGTMNIHSRRLVVWDLGALACSGRPDADELVRKVLLAACSIPGMAPAVEFDVTVNGQTYTELHGDGGAVSQVFIRFGPHHPRYGDAGPSGKWLTGSNLYLFAGGKRYADTLTGELSAFARLGGTVSGTLYALYRAELNKLNALCVLSGMTFNETAVPQEKKTSTRSTQFDTAVMQDLYMLGYNTGVAGIPWRHTPPGTDPGEEELPRAGLVFTVP